MHALKEGVKYTVIRTEMFPELGMKYIGPVDGHNLKQLEHAFRYARDYDGPLIIHVVTEKGRGYAPAENDEADLMHSTGIIDPVTGKPVFEAQPGWTSVFSKELLKAGRERNDIVAITAAMAGPTGLDKFGAEFPDRFFDVGIAERTDAGANLEVVQPPFDVRFEPRLFGEAPSDRCRGEEAPLRTGREFRRPVVTGAHFGQVAACIGVVDAAEESDQPPRVAARGGRVILAVHEREARLRGIEVALAVGLLRAVVVVLEVPSGDHVQVVVGTQLGRDRTDDVRRDVVRAVRPVFERRETVVLPETFTPV